MKTRLLLPLILLALIAPALFAADGSNIVTTTPISNWHATTLPQALGNVLLFAAIGIVAAIIGYKVFDKCTPGDLHKEILQNKNIAAAIVAGAVIIGVSIIIAAAMIG